MYEDLMDTIQENTPDIKIVGVGGGGNNAVQRMIENNLDGVEYIAVNTDTKALKNVENAMHINIGEKLTHGLGTGANPDIGYEAARQSREEISDAIGKADMVYLAATLGGGTGSGAIIDIAETAKKEGILTVVVVTKPFRFEGKMKMMIAENTILKLRQIADSVIIVPNEKLCEIAQDELKLKDAFYLADDVLFQAVRSLVELITRTGMINVDFADVKTTLTESGYTVFGSGEAEGENRSIQATEEAINSPLIETHYEAASRILVNITYGNITLNEMRTIGDRIHEWASNDAAIIIGCAQKPEMGNRLNVSIIATSFENDIITQDAKTEPIKQESPFMHTLKANGHIKTDASYKTKTQQPAAEPVVKKVSVAGGFDQSSPVLTTSEDPLDIPAFLRKKNKSDTH